MPLHPDVKLAVFGGELIDTSKPDFKSKDDVDFVGYFDDVMEAHVAWQSNAWRTVDNALMRYFVIPVPVNANETPTGDDMQDWAHTAA